MLLLTFNLKKISCLVFHCFFIVILEIHAPSSLNFSSPMTYSSKETSYHIAPSPQPPLPTKIIPLKTSVYLPITITVWKHWSKFVTCSPSLGDCGGASDPQRHSYYSVRLCWTKWLSQDFDPLTLGKMSVGGGLGALQLFGHFKRALEMFISVRMSPLTEF